VRYARRLLDRSFDQPSRIGLAAADYIADLYGKKQPMQPAAADNRLRRFDLYYVSRGSRCRAAAWRAVAYSQVEACRHSEAHLSSRVERVIAACDQNRNGLRQGRDHVMRANEDHSPHARRHLLDSRSVIVVPENVIVSGACLCLRMSAMPGRLLRKALPRF